MTEKIEAIRRAKHSLDQADQNIHDAVLAARAACRTWQEIGDALGVTRQAAQRKYG